MSPVDARDDDVGLAAKPPARASGLALMLTVARNRNLRRVQGAFVGSAIGDWAYATAIGLWAYQVGGATAVGVWLGVRMALMAVTTPFTATLADRFPRRTVMLVADLLRACLITVTAVMIVAAAPVATVFVVATLTSLVGPPFGIAQRGLLPQLAEGPEELAAANGVSSTIESLAIFVGPALGALLLTVTSVPVVLMVDVATFVWSMVLILGVRPRQRVGAAAGADDEPDDEPAASFLQDAVEGFRIITRDVRMRSLAVAVCAQTVVAGATGVFVLVLAAELLPMGVEGYGYLDALFGIGALVGGLLAISRASRGRLGTDLLAGVLLWSLPLALVWAWPNLVTCVVAMLLLGLGNPLVDVNFDTAVQRLTPDDVLGRVFGAFDALLIACMALGAFLMPVLLHLFGLRTSFLVIAVGVGLTVLLVARPVRQLDHGEHRPANLELWTQVDILAPLAPATVEALAFEATPERFAAGQVVVEQGDTSDRFFVIVSGTVRASADGRVLRELGPGDYFGEIGLLHDVPRTATITALSDLVVEGLGRTGFLAAVQGHRGARRAAERVARARLAT